MRFKFCIFILTASAVFIITADVWATHLTVSEEPGEPLLLYLFAGAGLSSMLLGVFFLLGIFLSRGVKKGWVFLAAGIALVVVGVIVTSDPGINVAEVSHRHASSFPLPLLLLLVFFGLGISLLLLWSHRTGQFREMEGVKHRMLERELSFLYDDTETEDEEQREDD